jgi:hypothetical protein
LTGRPTRRRGDRPDSDTTCVIQWKTGSTTSDGICSRNDDAFATGYVLGNSYGLVIYKVQEDGTMQGLWTRARMAQARNIDAERPDSRRQ